MVATIRDVYHTRIVRVTPDAMLVDVERDLLSRGSDEAYVVDPDDRLLGLVPDYELLKLRMLNLHDVGCAADVMTPGPPAVTLDSALEKAACHLRVHLHRSLPVIEAGRLVGRVDRQCILDWYVRQDPARQVVDAARDVGPARPKFLSSGIIAGQDRVTR